MASLFPEPYVVAHIRRVISDEKDPDTGNNVIVAYPPKIRRAISFSQIGRMRGSSKPVLGPEFIKRVATELHMTVSDPSPYGPEDQVIVFPDQDDDGDYVPGTGFAFTVDGIAVDSRLSPWPNLMKCMGGLVRIKRVT
jgi:hypothetical protein